MNKSIKTLTLVAGLVLSGRGLVAAAIHDAAIAGDLDAIKALIAKRVNLEAKDKYQKTPLQYAALNGHLDVVKALLDAKARVNAKLYDRLTALDLAAENGFLDVVELLHSRGGTIGDMALLGAVSGQRSLTNPDGTAGQPEKFDNSDVVQYLLDNGANPNAEEWGVTALKAARAYGNANIVNILMKAGAR